MKRIIAAVLFMLPVFAMAQQKQFNIYFAFDKSNINAAAKDSLDNFLQQYRPFLANNSITIYGHCDGKGNDSYNDKLSDRRVAAVKKYLLQKNIPATAFNVAKGYGKRKPLNSNSTDEERTLNRRVEIFASVPVVTSAGKPTAPIRVDAPPTKEKTLKEQFEDTAVKAGHNIVLKNILFVGAQHQFLPQSFPVLEELLTVMRNNKTLKIEIQGHICCLPGDVDGFDEQTGTTYLSVERAKAVYDYLIKNGIAAARLSYKGLGHSDPIYAYPEKDEMEKTGNRRVQIKIISK